MRARKFSLFAIINTLILSIYGITVFYPFYNAVIVSITSEKEYVNSKFSLFPKEPTFDAYIEIFNRGWLLNSYKATLFIVTVGDVYSMLLTMLCAYAMSRPGFFGKKALLSFMLIPMFFSGGLIPFYLLIRSLGLMNSLWAIILPSGISTFYMLLMKNFFEGIPKSLEESARLDGANDFRILFSIILPLSKPIIATVVLFTLVDLWNDWYRPMLFINSTGKRPLQLALRAMLATATSNSNSEGSLKAQQVYIEGVKMAAVVVTMVPVMLIYPFLQKYFAKGIMIGAVKG